MAPGKRGRFGSDAAKQNVQMGIKGNGCIQVGVRSAPFCEIWGRAGIRMFRSEWVAIRSVVLRAHFDGNETFRSARRKTQIRHPNKSKPHPSFQIKAHDSDKGNLFGLRSVG